MLLVKKIEVFLFMRGHNHFSSGHGRNDSVTEEYGQEAIDSAAQRLRSTRRISRYCLAGRARSRVKYSLVQWLGAAVLDVRQIRKS